MKRNKEIKTKPASGDILNTGCRDTDTSTSFGSYCILLGETRNKHYRAVGPSQLPASIFIILILCDILLSLHMMPSPLISTLPSTTWTIGTNM